MVGSVAITSSNVIASPLGIPTPYEHGESQTAETVLCSFAVTAMLEPCKAFHRGELDMKRYQPINP